MRIYLSNICGVCPSWLFRHCLLYGLGIYSIFIRRFVTLLYKCGNASNYGRINMLFCYCSI
ncbi:hypothetical protein NAI56_09335, partial [Francisella tularensis subsp. holarctica]